jgi:hypothetical protein
LVAHLTEKENYLRLMNGEIPEYVPTYWLVNWSCAPSAFRRKPGSDGTFVDHFGVEHVSVEIANGGAMPRPDVILLEDIRKWRDVIKRPIILDEIDWAATAKKDLDNWDPDKPRFGSGFICHGYFQSLVSFMGFTGALIACIEEPEEVKALMHFLLEMNLETGKKYLEYYKPDAFQFGDDIAHERSTFVSTEVFLDIFEPVWRASAAPFKEAGLPAHHHNCGKFEAFLPYIIDMGFNAWEPAQVSNDLLGIKAKYGRKLAFCTGVHSSSVLSWPEITEERLRAEVRRVMDLYAPGGGYAFLGNLMGPPGDEVTAQRNVWIRDEYEKNKFNYYT